MREKRLKLTYLRTSQLIGILLVALYSVAAHGSLRTFNGTTCYDRTDGPQTPIVDTHLHFRPFGGPAVPFKKMVQYLKDSGVLFANMYGIGQMRAVDSPCFDHRKGKCAIPPLIRPTMKNDFVNAVNYVTKNSKGIHLTLSMTFPDLANPESVLAGMELLDKEFPGLFKWMGEVNLVKEALFDRGQPAVPLATIARWKPFMDLLRERDMPIAIHSDLGNDTSPTLIKLGLRRFAFVPK